MEPAGGNRPGDGRPLGEAWQLFATVEFEVESLVSEPGLVAQSDPSQPANQPMIRLAFNLRCGEHSGTLEIAAPQSFFDSAGASPGPESLRGFAGA